MKGIKRSAKAGNGAEQQELPSSNEAARPLLPGLKIALGGLLLAAVLLWFGILAPSQQFLRSQLAQSAGAMAGSQLSQATSGLVALTDAAALDPALLKALRARTAVP